MKLYIRIGNLFKFKQVYDRSKFLQEVLVKETGIRWDFEDEYKDEIQRLLRDIRHDVM